MSSHSMLKKLMTHSLTIRKRERDWQGSFSDKKTFSTRGFVQYGTKLVTDRKGEETTASAIIFLPDIAPIDPAYEHWMIDQTTPYTREGMEVIRIDPVDDPRTGKIHHYEVAVR